MRRTDLAVIGNELLIETLGIHSQDNISFKDQLENYSTTANLMKCIHRIHNGA